MRSSICDSGQQHKAFLILPALVAAALALSAVGAAAVSAAPQPSSQPLVSSLATAQALWPGVPYDASGATSSQGQFIIPFDGGYALLTTHTTVTTVSPAPTSPAPPLSR